MAVTAPDNLYSPDDDDGYALVQDMGLGQDTVQAALVRRANAYKGTAAERNAFTTAPEGTQWVDTDGSRKTYIRENASWSNKAYTVTASGNSGAISSPGPNVVTTRAISFPANRFNVNPTVILQNATALASHAQTQMRVTGLSTSGFTLEIYNTGSNTINVTVHWIAVEP